MERPRRVGDREARAVRIYAGLAERAKLLVASPDQLVPRDGRLAVRSLRPARLTWADGRGGGHGLPYRRPWNRNASMNGSMSPSITASTLPISTFVRWSLMSW